MPARAELPAIIAAGNQDDGRYRFCQASLETYFEALARDLGDRPLQTLAANCAKPTARRAGGGRPLPHVLSARMNLKLQNERGQMLLERWAESWSAVCWLQGEDYPAGFLWKAWEWLLQNHAHDSICGCSVDAVHAQTETRFACATEIAEEITGERLQLLTQQVDLSGLREVEAALIAFNALPWALPSGPS